MFTISFLGKRSEELDHYERFPHHVYGLTRCFFQTVEPPTICGVTAVVSVVNFQENAPAFYCRLKTILGVVGEIFHN